MIGRGLDQISAHPCDPALHEPWIRNARDYVLLAERRSGIIPRAVTPDYVWGDALPLLKAGDIDFRIINLETALTSRGKAEAKGINYRSNPANAEWLVAANIDCCVVANNHVGDWGASGIADTIDALARNAIASTGAGLNYAAAASPAVLQTLPGRRLLVFAYACPSSGVPLHWNATARRPGVNMLTDLSEETACRVAAQIEGFARPDDVLVVSIHWGPNWGYDIPQSHRRFAHAFIDTGHVHVIYGHSSHHPLPIEIHAGRPILFGCGDFINDYECIAGHETYRPDLVLGYVIDISDTDQTLRGLTMLPFQIRKFRLNRPLPIDVEWLSKRLTHQSGLFGRQVIFANDGTLLLV